jgi:hypothetical protein
MRTADLTGDSLDYWVARAEGIEHPPYLRVMQPGCCLIPVTTPDEDGTMTRWVAYQPSTDWAVGGPIVERERSSFDACWGNLGWYVRSRHAPCDGDQFFGDTLLIAAMRAYVASKFGRDVADPSTEAL